ncbi:MAG: type III pantothenate kinase [Bacteroidia bacterium]|nr:type III pantothenate kinase [Bacteroidia bacterium]
MQATSPAAMDMTIDIGNSNTKVVLFENDMLKLRKVFKEFRVADARMMIKSYKVSKTILSSVKAVPRTLTNYLAASTRIVIFNQSTAIPVKNKYKSPSTLGRDRLASVIGARKLFPGIDILVIDAGTCIKYDFISRRGDYSGGSISPGMDMRFKALHQFTDQLPLVKADALTDFIGQSTRDAINTGVQTGILLEMEGFIRLYRKRYKPLRVVMTGGDALRFAGQLNLPIFAASDLVNIGLHEILKYNAG